MFPGFDGSINLIIKGLKTKVPNVGPSYFFIWKRCFENLI